MPDREAFKDMRFPLAGIDLSNGFQNQKPRRLPNGDYARTTRFALNVRAYDAESDRARGGSRAGLARYIAAPVVADWIVQELATLVGVGYPPPGGTMQQSSSGRIVNLVAVSQGSIYSARPGDATWTPATNGTGQATALNFTGIVRSTSLNQKLYFVDGTHYTYFDPSVNTAYRLVATAGSLPADANGNAPRLCCTWRGRLVLSGIVGDPHNWFMSAVGDPTNYNYFPDPFVSTAAVAGNNSPLGLVGDVVTGLIPLSDDMLLFGCDHELWIMKGDPADGGTLNPLTRSLGMAFGNACAQDPYGNVYFVSNCAGVYMMEPGGMPQRISQQVEQLLLAFDTGATTIRCAWNDRYQGLHIFPTPTGAAAVTTDLFWEKRTGAWWADRFGHKNQNPLCCCTFDGNAPDDRAVLIGSWDGYVRSFSAAAEDDDGYTIQSSVLIGPVNSKDFDKFILKDLQCIMSEESNEVAWSIYSGATAEKATQNAPVASGTFPAGRSPTRMIGRGGYSLYVRIDGASPWALEQLRLRVAMRGKVQRRG